MTLRGPGFLTAPPLLPQDEGVEFSDGIESLLAYRFGIHLIPQRFLWLARQLLLRARV